MMNSWERWFSLSGAQESQMRHGSLRWGENAKENINS